MTAPATWSGDMRHRCYICDREVPGDDLAAVMRSASGAVVCGPCWTRELSGTYRVGPGRWNSAGG